MFLMAISHCVKDVVRLWQSEAHDVPIVPAPEHDKGVCHVVFARSARPVTNMDILDWLARLLGDFR